MQSSSLPRDGFPLSRRFRGKVEYCTALHCIASTSTLGSARCAKEPPQQAAAAEGALVQLPLRKTKRVAYLTLGRGAPQPPEQVATVDGLGQMPVRQVSALRRAVAEGG